MSLSSIREWRRRPLSRKDLYFAFLILLVVAILPFAGAALTSPGNTTYYVDFDNGSDSNDGLSQLTAWQHAPGDSNATSTASVTLAAGDTVLFKGGVHYRGSITINASGTSGNPITYKGDGWGSEKAIIDGSEPVTGWTACADAASCGNNANWSHIYHATIPSIPSFLTSTPEIRLNVIQDGLPIITSQIPESTSRYYQETSTYYSVPPSNVSNTTISDSRLATLGGSALVGSYVYIWKSPNDVAFVKISAFDTGTNTITFPSTTLYTNKNTLYAIANYFGDTVFNREGQYYFNPVVNGSGTYDLYVWPLGNIDLSSTGTVTTSVRSVGININAKDYVTIEGFYLERQTGDSNGEGSSIYQSNSSRSNNVLIHNNEVTLSNGSTGGSISVQWIDSSTISNNYVHDTLANMRGIQAGGATQMTISGNQVRNISRTGIYFGDVDNSSISGNSVSDIFSSHGNGITVYQGSDNVDVFNNVIRNSNVDYTMESSSNIRTFNNLMDGYNVTGNVVADWGGMSGANTFMNNTIINSNNSSSMYIAGGGTSSWIIENNIIDGGGRVTYVGGGVTFANNIYTSLAFNQSSKYGWSLGPGESVVTNLDLLFVSPASDDYRLSSTSPAIDAGLNLASYLNDDLLGVSRPQGAGFDIGAYEYESGGSGDTTPPAMSGGSPSGVLSSGTTGTTISLTTDENATCRYATSGGISYSSMSAFSSTGNTSHSTSVSGLNDGNTYTYYVKCRDSSSNTSIVDYAISFSVGSDTTPPIISGVTISAITTTGATITWNTNESADTQVEYGDTLDDYPNQNTLNTTLATSHSSTISGLSPSTTYFFRALSRDPSGNLQNSTAFSFTTLASLDTTPPVISSIASSTTGTTATLTWSTDEISAPTVNYGLTSGYGSASSSSLYATASTIILSGLTPSTLYHFKITATDASDNDATSTDLTFTTTVATDTTPPTISSISSGTPTNTSATISWTTNENADSTLNYGLSASYGTASTSAVLSTSHLISLSGLTPSTTYHYQVESSDAASNTATSSDRTFTTAATPDTTAPVVSALTATSIALTSATITWTTDENADSKVEYGVTTSYGNSTSLNTSLVTSHSENLSGLLPNTLYHYRVISKDASSNQTISSDGTFTTVADTTAPSISNISSAPSGSSAIISWTTDESANSQVNYGLSSAYGSSSSLNASFVASHTVTLSSLATSTTYHYKIISIDSSGNVGSSSDQVFVTTDGLTNTVIDDRANAGHNPSSIIPIQITPTVEVIVPTLESIFKRNLTVGDTGVDVLTLQKILLMKQYLETGYDTGYFGEKTRQALISFQKFTGITPATGYLGPKTIAMIIGKSIPQSQTAPAPVAPTPTPVPTPTPAPVVTPPVVLIPPQPVVTPTPVFVPPTVEVVPETDPSLVSDLRRTLSIGSQGVDVAILQQLLKNQGYYAYSVSGFYDANTALATDQYQQTHGVTTEPGFVGPLTRSLVNARK